MQIRFIDVLYNFTTRRITLSAITNMLAFYILLETRFKNLPQKYVIQAQISGNTYKIINDQDINILKSFKEKIVKAVVKQWINQNIQNNKQYNKIQEIYQILNTYNKPSPIHPISPNPLPSNLPHTISNPTFPISTIFELYCILCNNQKKTNIIYKCSVCPNYIICLQCQDKYYHQHPFIKIKNQEYQHVQFYVQFQNVNQLYQSEHMAYENYYNQQHQTHQQKQPTKIIPQIFKNIFSTTRNCAEKLIKFPKQLLKIQKKSNKNLNDNHHNSKKQQFNSKNKIFINRKNTN